MSSLVEKRINRSGPYIYRVSYTGENNGNTHKWEYLGLAGHIDPRRVAEDLDAHPLTDDEIDELREEDQLSQFRKSTDARFASLTVANDVRAKLISRYGEDALAPADDRRLPTVTVADDAPPAAKALAEQEARDDRERADTPGQADLTDGEKDRLDFSETNIMHARSAKAVILNQGIDDWTSIYDPQVDDPAAFRGVVEDNRESIHGDRRDEETDNVAMTREQADSQLEKRAIAGAADGIEEAADQLREEFGYTDAEIEGLTA